MAVLDLLGVAASGTATELSRLIRNHAVSHFAAAQGGSRILFDGRICSIPGAALAGGMLIDSVDAHDGHKPTKGHVGCGVLPAALSFAEADVNTSEVELLTWILLGYEVGARCGIALHETAGIAEYHGPRSQMMRCIDHPTMLKDGSGWGSMAGCSAALLAQDGFTGAPALTIESDEVQHLWSDLGTRWMICEQYVKAYPVCRWAQPAIAGVMAIRKQRQFAPEEVRRIEIGTFHESKRLAVSTPSTTEQAQYSLPFPTAAAIVHGDVSLEHIDGEGLSDESVLRLSRMTQLTEVDEYNQCFPGRRKSHVAIELSDGSVLESGTVEAAGDPENPFSDTVIEDKFMRFASKPLTESLASRLKAQVLGMEGSGSLEGLTSLIYEPALTG